MFVPKSGWELSFKRDFWKDPSDVSVDVDVDVEGRRVVFGEE